MKCFWSKLLPMLLSLVSGLLLCATVLAAEPGSIRGVRIASSINPVVADFIETELTEANRIAQNAFLIKLDTPGGLDTAMRDIIQDILASDIPVIVYVAPSGARAASAGAMITLAADFAVMAPGTNVGAAHPVSIGVGVDSKEGTNEVMTAKVVNDAVAYARSIARQKWRNQQWAEQIVRESISTPAEEALEMKVIDLVAETEAQLLSGLDGLSYRRNGEAIPFQSVGSEIIFYEMNWRQKILNTVSNPNIAYMLLMLGIIGIFFEVSQPGVILPGAIGVIALLLAFLGLQMLPVNYVGVLLIICALILFLLEIKVVSYGMLSVGGIISLIMGSLVLIDSSQPYQKISLAVIAATVSVFSGFILIALYFIVRTQKRQAVSGLESMVGEQMDALTAIDGQGRVFVHSEYWTALADEPIAAGDPIEVIGIAGRLQLQVRSVAGNKQESKQSPSKQEELQ